MDKRAEEICKRSTEVYSKWSQMVKAVEEMAELQKALCKAVVDQKRFEEDRQKIKGEMADVSLMLDQLEVLFGDYSAEKSLKMDRLAERMKISPPREPDPEGKIRAVVPIFNTNLKCGVCPTCGGAAEMVQYINYCELPQEEFLCGVCGKRYYRVFLFAGVKTSPNGLWNWSDYAELYDGVMKLADERKRKLSTYSGGQCLLKQRANRSGDG